MSGSQLESVFSSGLPGTSRSIPRLANSRRAASAMIAKIPFPLAQHIARVFREA